MDKKQVIHPILLFDGVCNLCNATVQFCIRQDKKGIIRYASLQSDIGQEFLKKFNMSTDDLTTIILVEGDKFYTQSSAALRLAKHFGGAWTLLYGFIIIPKPIRNFFYDIISRNRYRWFGKQESCMMPSEEMEGRFL